jgi:hypothetical protein
MNLPRYTCVPLVAAFIVISCTTWNLWTPEFPELRAVSVAQVTPLPAALASNTLWHDPVDNIQLSKPLTLDPVSLDSFVDSPAFLRSRFGQAWATLHSRQVDSTLHFAVVVNSFFRNDDPHFLFERLMSWAGVSFQSYPHWTMVAVADGFTTQQFESFQLALSRAFRHHPSRVVALNLHASLRETDLHRDSSVFTGSKCTVHCLAGANAGNLGLEFTAAINRKKTFFTHVARLDFDDRWTPHHLQNLVDGFRAIPGTGLFPSCSFSFSLFLSLSVRVSVCLCV